jgi:hypothetical protein
MIRSAVITPGGLYRMQLIRSESLRGPFSVADTIMFMMNNPSKADAETDDPTVKRIWAFSQLWKYRQMIVVNTNPVRSTDPRGAYIPSEIVLTNNDTWVRHAMQHSALSICAWGDKAHPELARRAVNLLSQLGPVHVLGVTKAGNPRHPLYLPANTMPVAWRPKGLH